MAVTIKDVSAKCGLSISTVSKAFNNYSDISPETRELVHRVAREIGYYPNAIARTLKTNRSYNLGVLFSDDAHSGLTHSFFASVLDAFKSEAEREGYDITFITHHVGRADMTFLEHCRYRNVDGVCVVCANFYTDEMAELMQSDIPCVTIDHAFKGRSCVMSENAQGMQALVRHAASLGHRRIAFVHGQPSAVTDSRISGYRAAMEALQLDCLGEYLVDSIFDNPAESYRAMKQLMALPQPPTCVLLPDDHSSLGALEAAADLGLRVPEDVSVAGYDGIRLTQMLRPRLTTIQQDTRTMGALAAQRLIQQVENGGKDPGGADTVPGLLLVGESMGPVKG